MRQPPKNLFAFLLLLFTPLVAQAQGSCVDPCDVRLPPGYFEYATFQNIVNTAVDDNGNGSYDICFSTGTWIGNLKDGRGNQGIDTIIIDRDQVHIIGPSDKRTAGFYYVEVGAVPSPTPDPNSKPILAVLNSTGFQMDNLSVFERGLGQVQGIILYNGAKQVILSDLNIWLDSWRDVGIVVYATGTASLEEWPEVTSIQDIEFTFNTNELAPEGESSSFGYGVYSTRSRIKKIANITAKNSDAYSPDVDNSQYLLYLTHSEVETISGIKSYRNEQGGFIHSALDFTGDGKGVRISNIEGDFGYGISLGGSYNIESLENISIGLLPRKNPNGYGCKSVGVFGTGINSMRNISIRNLTEDPFACGIVFSPAYSHSLKEITNYHFGDAGTALTMRGGNVIENLTHYDFTSLASAKGGVIEASASSAILNLNNGSIEVPDSSVAEVVIKDEAEVCDSNALNSAYTERQFRPKTRPAL